MPEEITQYRSAVTDALGRVIPDDGELRVWLDDDLADRAAPDGWIHLISAREVAFLLLTGRVVELSLDHDLAGAEDDVYDGSDEAEAPEMPEPVESDELTPAQELLRFGNGGQVIDFIDEHHGNLGHSLWPRDGITIHSGNGSGRKKMMQAIESAAPRSVSVEKTTTASGKPRYEFEQKASE